MIDLSISLLSYNNKELLKNCLDSIYKQSFSANKNTKNIKFEILLVDNASKDGAVEMVKKNFPKVKLLANKTNKLFIKGHNQNLRRVKGRYFLILNEDTQIPKGALGKMVSFMNQDPRIGLASCRQVGEDGTVDKTCSKFPQPLYEILEIGYINRFLGKLPLAQKLSRNYRYSGWDRKSTKMVGVLPGSFIVGKKEVIAKIGYFDEDLLFFYGEADFCQRAKKAGFKIYHKGDVVFTHFGSKGLKKLNPFARYQLVHHDILVYYRKYFGGVWWLILWFALAPNWLYWKLRR